MINYFFGRFLVILIVMVYIGNYWEFSKFCFIEVFFIFYRELEIFVIVSFIFFFRFEKNNLVLYYLLIRVLIMMGVNGLCVLLFLFFLFLFFVFEIVRVFLEKNILIVVLIYLD